MAGEYGGVLLDNRGAVIGFTRRGDSRPSYHFIGVQAAEAEAFAALDDGVPAESVLELYPRLMAARSDAVMGFVSDASFQDIGTPGDLLRTSLDLAAADGRRDRPRWGRHVRVAASASVTRSLLWDDVSVGEEARLEDCIVGDGVAIPAGLHVSPPRDRPHGGRTGRTDRISRRRPAGRRAVVSSTP